MMRLLRILRRPSKLYRRPLRRLRRYPRLIKRVVRILKPFAAKLVIFPLNKFSGKCFAAAEAWAAITVFLQLTAFLGQSPLSAVGIPTQTGLIYTSGAFGLSLFFFAVTYPLDREGIIREYLISTGLLRIQQESAGFLSFAIGLATAATLTIAVGNKLFVEPASIRSPLQLEVQRNIVIAVALLSLLLSSVAARWLFQQMNKDLLRDGLSIVDIKEQDEDMKEVIIQNDGDGYVTLYDAKFEDSLGNKYIPDEAVAFRPGEKHTLELPADFVFEETLYRVPFFLKPVYSDTLLPKIYTRTGETFIVKWEG